MEKHNCSNRREFLVKSTALAGGIVLSLTGVSSAKSADADPDDVTIKLDEKSPLSKVGGSYTFDYKGDKIIVIRSSETKFAAFSAFCTHKGTAVNYDAKSQQFVCPNHGSRFASDGSNVSGQAKQPLASFATENAVVVSLKL